MKQPYCENQNDCALSSLGLLAKENLKDHFVFLGLDSVYSKTTTEDLHAKIMSEIEQYWTKRHSKIKFVQLQRIFEARCRSKRLVTQVFINRILTILIAVFCGSLIFWLYIGEVISGDGRMLRWVKIVKLVFSYKA